MSNSKFSVTFIQSGKKESMRSYHSRAVAAPHHLNRIEGVEHFHSSVQQSQKYIYKKTSNALTRREICADGSRASRAQAMLFPCHCSPPFPSPRTLLLGGWVWERSGVHSAYSGWGSDLQVLCCLSDVSALKGKKHSPDEYNHQLNH